MKKKKKGEEKRSVFHKLFRWLHSVDAKSTLILFITFILLFLLFCLINTTQRYDLHVGSISHYTINATKDVVDELSTEEKRKAAADAVEPTYHLQEGASEQVMADLGKALGELRLIQQYGLTLKQEDETEAQFHDREFDATELDYAKGMLDVMSLSNYQLSTLLHTTTETFDVMSSTVTLAVENALNTTIREGQVTPTIQTILQIIGYRVDTSLFQNIVPTLLRTCIKPNMVIEQESTEAARQAARDAVEPVIYLQGQNVVREGERVTTKQLEILKALGLLKTSVIGWSTYAGAAVMMAFAVLALAFLLRLQDQTLLHNLRKLLVICGALVVSLTICAVVMKTLGAVYAPVILTAILLTGLTGPVAAAAASVSNVIAMICMCIGSESGFTSESFHLILFAIAGSLFAISVLAGKPQRIRILLCGFLSSLINILCHLAVGKLHGAALATLMPDMPYYVGAGILTGVLAIGIQPVFETLFNLATPSKLLELGNPNHPLLRRLLLEAPGTYHHSIIVANLAEAAAEKIGANPLLARTGAYFHDVGKLKRPLYFKENQMGENPHDKTDPYVSAAIVTAHTRDGVQLAQKYHLPSEVQSIIAQHHGDTPVMFFYHKAVQQADGRSVDISDFRYDGTRPATKEGAIIMLADTVEAAVRAMPDPTPQAIEKNIDRLVRGKLDDGQLNNSPLTLKDVEDVCAAFARVLVGVFHERIEYPNVDVPKRGILESEAESREKA